MSNRSLSLWTVLLALVVVSGCARDPRVQKAKYLASAEKYMAAHKYNEAIIQYRNALKFEPTSAILNFSLAEAYQRAGNYREAFVSCKKATELDPSNVNAQLALGGFYLVSGEYEEAIQRANAVLLKEADRSDAMILLANAYGGKKDIAHGIEILEELISKKPNELNGRLNLAVFYSAQGRPNLAREQFETAVRLNPRSPEAHRALANFYVTQKMPDQAEEQLHAALEADATSIGAKQSLVSLYIQQGKSAQAEALLKQIVAEQKNSAQSRFDLATFYIGQKRVEDASKIDSEVAHENPNFLPARFQMAEIAMQAKKLDEAEGIIGSILKERPREPQALIFHGRILLERKDPTKAIKELEAAQELEPNMAMLHYLLGVAYAQSGNLERAQSSFERSIALNQKFNQSYLALSQMMLDRGEAAVSLRYAEQVLRSDPDDVNALLLQGNAYGQMRAYSKSGVAFERYAKLVPASPVGPIRLGLLAAAQKHYDLAEKHFEQALAMDPHNYEALNDLVGVYLYQKKAGPAIERIKQQMQKDAGAEIYNLLGKTYTAEGQFGPAEAALKRALEIDPQNFNGYILLGNVYAQQKSLDKALAQYKAATRINAKNASLWTIYGILNEQAGRPADAEQAYEKALQISPNAAAAANNLAWLFAQQGKEMDRALELARSAKVALPNAASVSDTLGWIYYKRQLYSSAIPLLREAVKQQPDHAEYHFHLAVSLLAAGKTEGARTELAKALDLDASLRKRAEVQSAIGTLKL